MKNQRLAVGLMIGQAILFAIETAMIHHLGSRASAMQLALLRSSAGLLLVGCLENGLVGVENQSAAVTTAARIRVGHISMGADVFFRPLAIC